MSATDLVHAANTDVGRPAREAYADDQRQLIRRTIAPDATDAEFDLFLEVSARYGLNPITGEVYLAKMPGSGGGAPKWTIIVSRAGFLALAQRHPSFGGIDSDVVRAFDEFTITHGEDGPKVHHRYELGFDNDPGEEEGGDPAMETEPRPGRPAAGEENAEQRIARKRGKIVGAWALVHRRDRRPAFYFAPWTEYAPRDVTRNRSWRMHPSAMIKKCAVSNALREAFSLSGLYSDAEMERSLHDGTAEVHDEPEWPEGAEGEYLRALIAEANRQRPGSYRPGKVRLLLAGSSDEEREAFVAELERKVQLLGGTPPERPEAEAEGVPVDAELVD